MLRVCAAVCGLLWLSPLAAAQTIDVFHAFSPSEGRLTGPLILGNDGNFYGRTVIGAYPDSVSGAVFRISPAGAITWLHTFEQGGVYTLIQGSDGDFFGSADHTIFRMTPGGSVTVLYTVPGLYVAPNNLIQGADGSLYGTIPTRDAFGGGTIFKLTLSGTFTILAQFNGSGDNVVYSPLQIIESASGNFYTLVNSANDVSLSGSTGSVLQVFPAGSYVWLHTFTPSADGTNGVNTILQATDGDLVVATQGITPYYGSSTFSKLFRMTADGSVTPVYVFPDTLAPPEEHPFVRGLIQGSDGAFYGTTASSRRGGANPSVPGTIFRMSASGAVDFLYTFSGGDDGSLPFGLVEGNGGDLYGTTASGGAFCQGVVYRLSHTASQTSLAAGAAQNSSVSDPGLTPTPACAQPTVRTFSATSVGLSSATLQGNVNANGLETTANFEYGLTTAYGSTTAVQSAGSAYEFPVPIGGGAITGLTCSTLYHYRATATNASGTTNGLDATFTTAACPLPSATTGVATTIGQTSATLNGTANPNGFATNAHFEYGRTNGYGNTTPTQALGSGIDPLAIGGGALTGLACGTLYHFRAAATNAGGTRFGSDATFMTAACTKGDLNGDGMADLLWRNGSTGQNIGWLMNGLTVAGAAFLPTIADTNWKVRGVGDVDGDGKSDVIWRNNVTGQDIGWIMNGLTVANSAFLPTIADTNWDIVGVGDFDGDGKADVILRNKATGENIGWLMSGLTVSSSAFLPTIGDTSWEIVGVGDLDGDGRADVLLRNKSTGQNIGWLMNGLTVSTSAFLPTIADTNWEIKGVGDFDGDGKADVVLRNKMTGQNIGWLMNGLTVSTSAFLPTIADTNWEMKGIVDLDGDGKADVILRNKVSGQNIGWLMNGLTVSTSAFLPTIADTNWQFVSRGL